MYGMKTLEVHSDTGFRREENEEEGEVDGKAVKGVNIIRLGQQLSDANGLVTFICHLIDWIIGVIKVVVAWWNHRSRSFNFHRSHFS